MCHFCCRILQRVHGILQKVSHMFFFFFFFFEINVALLLLIFFCFPLGGICQLIIIFSYCRVYAEYRKTREWLICVLLVCGIVVFVFVMCWCYGVGAIMGI